MPLLNWFNRDADLARATRTPYRLLEPIDSLSHGDEETENLLIEGDNLDALKALLPYQSGQVKCIYADPPFNTGQAFADYDDNIEHSIWLSMMYPSLELQRDLLREDGTLFIHIDDNELGYLIAIADEIMGRKNRIGIVTFKQGAATGHKAINPGMVNTTNFLLVYAKNKAHWKPNRIFTGRERDKRYNRFLTNPSDDCKKWKFITLAAAISEHTGKSTKELKAQYGEGLEEYTNDFVIQHARQVVRPARPDYDAVGEDAKNAIDASVATRGEVILLERTKHPSMYFLNGERIIFYSAKLKDIDGELIAGEPLTTLWDDLLSNNLHKEGGVELPKSKKPEALLKRCLELVTVEGDLVLDCFLGSGTTAAVAHKMRRRWIGIERGEHARTKCHVRLKAVVDGDDSGISKSVGWSGGGGFRYYTLGAPVFDDAGQTRDSITFEHMAAHVWYAETGAPRRAGAKSNVFLGEHNSIGYYLLFNGILGDNSNSGGNVLTKRLLGSLTKFDGQKVFYGEACTLSEEQLRELCITFRQTPYDIKAR